MLSRRMVDTAEMTCLSVEAVGCCVVTVPKTRGWVSASRLGEVSGGDLKGCRSKQRFLGHLDYYLRILAPKSLRNEALA